MESKFKTYTQYLSALGRGTCLSTRLETWNVRDYPQRVESSQTGSDRGLPEHLSPASCWLLEQLLFLPQLMGTHI